MNTKEHGPLNISSVTDKLLMVLFFTVFSPKSLNFPLFHLHHRSLAWISLTMIGWTHLHCAALRSQVRRYSSR